MRKWVCIVLAICLVVCSSSVSLLTLRAEADDMADVNLSITATAIHSSKAWSDTAGEKAIDGDWSTFFQANGDQTSEWVCVELSQVSRISSIHIWEYYTATEAYFDNIQYSLDSTNGVNGTWHELPYTRGTTINYQANSYQYEKPMGGTASWPPSAGRKRVYNCTGTVAAKYIKVTAATVAKMHITELEIFGEALNTRLDSLSLSKGELSPAFDEEIYSYEVIVDSASDFPDIIATAQDQDANVNIVPATTQTMKAMVEVTSKGGEYTQIYTIYFISAASNADLLNLELSYGELLQSFKRDVTEYSCIADANELPVVSANAVIETAKISITQPTLQSPKAVIRVTSADNCYVMEYTINFILTGTMLSSLTAGTKELTPVFEPDVMVYAVFLNSTESIPQVSASAEYENAMVTITQATEQTMLTTVKVTSSLGEQRVYNILFVRPSTAEGGKLTRIGVDSSTTRAGTVMENAIDGDYNTWWHSASNILPWISVELEDISAVKNVVLYGSSPDLLHNNDYCKVEYSIDGNEWILAADAWTGNTMGSWASVTDPVYLDANNQAKVFSGRRRTFTFNTEVYAKYIRIGSIRTAGNSIRVDEFEVHGRPINSYLKELNLSKYQLVPEFNKNVYSYEVFTDSLADLPEIIPVADDAQAHVNIIPATEESMKTVIEVTSKGGEYTQVYTVYLISVSENTELRSLSISGGELSPSFDRSVTEYNVVVDEMGDLPTVGAIPMVDKAEVEITQATRQSLKAVIKVTSVNGEETKVYTVNYIETGTSLYSLTADEKEIIPVFDPDVTSYVVMVGEGEAWPIINVVPKYDNATVEITQATEQTRYATVKVISLLGQERIYTIVIGSKDDTPSNARLAFIGVSPGNLSEVFRPDQTEYVVYPERKSIMPTVMAVAENASAQIEVIPATEKTMTASIVVTSEDGENTMEYTVYFATNIALGRNGYCSTNFVGGDAFKAFDDDFYTDWRSITGVASEWLVCNLDGGAKIFDITIYQNYSPGVTYFDTIRVSDDGRNWTDVPNTLVVTPLDYQVSGVPAYRIDYTISPVDAHYVMITGTSPGALRIQELQLFGVREPTISSNSYLKDMQVSNGQLSPAFSSYITNYTVRLEKDDTLPVVTAQADDSFATVEITQATDSTMQALVTVIAENGLSKSVYSIIMDKEIEAEKDARLSALSISTGRLNQQFSPNIARYTVYLMPDEPIPDITAIPTIQGANVSIHREDYNALIIVRSKDGTAFREYTLDFQYANADLSDLIVDGVELPSEFKPETLTYVVDLLPGTELPEVLAIPDDENATVEIIQATEQTMTATVMVKADGMDFIKTYTVLFRYMQSLVEAQTQALSAIRDYTVHNATTETDIMDVIRKEIVNEFISAEWKSDFQKTIATSSKTGLITGVVTLHLGEESADIEIRKTIPKRPSGNTGGGVGGGGGTGGVYNAAVIAPIIQTQPENIDVQPVGTGAVKENIKGHWAEFEINALVEKGIVQGNGESFALEDNVTRAEFIAMLMRACHLEPMTYKGAFEDVAPEDWHAGYIQTAYDNNLAQGHDGKFYPDQHISREQAAKILMAFYELLNGTQKIDNRIIFSDSNEISDWAREIVSKAVGLGLIKGFPTNEFRPLDCLTRAQAMVIVYRLIGGTL